MIGFHPNVFVFDQLLGSKIKEQAFITSENLDPLHTVHVFDKLSPVEEKLACKDVEVINNSANIRIVSPPVPSG